MTPRRYDPLARDQRALGPLIAFEQFGREPPARSCGTRNSSLPIRVINVRP
jgi:hypothetical protein